MYNGTPLPGSGSVSYCSVPGGKGKEGEGGGTVRHCLEDVAAH